MKLPKISYGSGIQLRDIIQLRSINYGDMLQDGDLTDSVNISARRFPYIATRRARAVIPARNCTAVTATDKLITVRGERVYCGEDEIGAVSAGEKQMVTVNTKVVIWPDKVYVDMAAEPYSLRPLGASVTLDGISIADNVITGTDVDFTQLFNVGDTLRISGCINIPENNIDCNIEALTETTITIRKKYALTDGVEERAITVERNIPDLDYICESDNRIWGCSSREQIVRCCALGDPTNWWTFEGIDTDAYAVAVGTKGPFTGCTKYASSVLFWKENVLHKVLGSFPSEFVSYQYTVEGLAQGCHKTQQVINEQLVYLGVHGVYLYNGSYPTLISHNFGQKVFTGGSAGNDGDTYILSAQDREGQWHLFEYETRENLWVHVDYVHAVDFARIGRDVYFNDSDGKLWLYDAGEDDPDVEWHAQLAPLYETDQGNKRYVKMIVRIELPKGSSMAAFTRFDGGEWRKVGTVAGNVSGLFNMVIPINRCDKFEVRFEGHGPCTIKAINREFILYSEVK